MLVSEEWVFHTGLCVQANSLRGCEGRGKPPERGRSGQCVPVVKVNMMDGDWEGHRARASISIEEQSSYGRNVGLRCNTGGLCRPGRLGSTSLGSNCNNCNHTVQSHIHTLQLNHTGIPERTYEVTRNKRGTYVPPDIWTFEPFITESPLSSRGGIKADLFHRLRRRKTGFPGETSPLGDMRGGWWVPPETPAPFGVLLTQDLLLALALLLRSQVAVLLLQEPHGRPAMLLKVPLVF